jgi:ribosomal protein S18 acetylase RimI-like enzyme
MKIEHPLPNDVTALRQLWQDAFGDTDSYLALFISTAFQQDHCLCIREDGRLRAAAYWIDCEVSHRKAAYIYAVATQPEYRGRGIASNLLKEALQLVEQSCKFDCVALIPSSTESKRLYERLGFEDRQKPMLFPASDYLGTGSVPHDLAMIKLCK